MTNIEKIKRILDAGHWVKADYKIITSYHDDEFSYIKEGSVWVFLAAGIVFKYSELEVIQRIPTPYQPGDKVLVLSNPSNDNKTKEAMVWKICEIKDVQCGCYYDVWNEDKTNYWYFPSYCLAPAFEEELTLSGKEVTVTIDGKEYIATFNLK